LTEANSSTSFQETFSQTGDSQGIQKLLEGTNTGWIILIFLLLGLLLSLTPCVLPMIPILLGHLLGKQRGTKQSFFLSFAYTVGVVSVYTSFGLLAGITGENLSLWLQKPIFLISFALLLVLFALSMFGVFQLKIPNALENKLTAIYAKQPKFRALGAFIMGVLSALMVGPCITPALLGVLLYIAQTHDLWLGGLSLAFLGLGMCLPLLILGTLSAKFSSTLNKLNRFGLLFKGFFGVILLFLALWMVLPLISNRYIPDQIAQWRGIYNSPKESSDLKFIPVKTVEELDDLLKRYKDHPVLLDFYATWCVACIEMEHKTFSDPKVKQALQSVILIRVDVTEHSEADRAFYQRFNIFGPPMILWFDQDGQEMTAHRITGFVGSVGFLDRLSSYLKAREQTPPKE
jgi:thiol:disulfide interchange protein DsbD